VVLEGAARQAPGSFGKDLEPNGPGDSVSGRPNRDDIPTPEVVPGANSWEGGRTVQTRLEEMDFKQ
jgi:hypothetical protein